MTATIVNLPGSGPIAAAPDAAAVPSVVDRLEQLLADAKAGRMRALAYAFVDRRGNAFTAWISGEGEPTGHALIAAVSYLHHEILDEKCSDGNVASGPQ